MALRTKLGRFHAHGNGSSGLDLCNPVGNFEWHGYSLLYYFNNPAGPAATRPAPMTYAIGDGWNEHYLASGISDANCISIAASTLFSI